jgi:4-amino-4-deoxy-L-arabinose transferase-like glycosyltransferase
MTKIRLHRSALASMGLALLLALVFLPALGAPEASTHPDERFYLGISAEMDARGEWLTPTLEGRPTWQKPPLLYWAEILCYRVLGRTLFAGRLPVALCAIGLCLATGALSRRLFGAKAGALAALLCATALGTLRFGRVAMMDVPMSLAMTLAALYVFRAAKERKGALLVVAGVFVGLACLFKGPVAAIVAGVAFGLFLFLHAREVLWSRWALYAIGATALVALPYYLAALAVHGRTFWAAFFVDENARRFGYWTASKELELLVGFLVFLLPWLPLALGNLRAPWRDEAMALVILWIATTLVIFSIPGHKYPHYGLLCAPAAIALAAGREPPRWALWMAAAVLLVAGLAALALVRFSLPWPPRAALGAVGLLLVAAGALAAVRQLSASATAAAVAVALTLGVVIPRASPPLFPQRVRAALAGRELFLFKDQPGVLGFIGVRARRVFGEAEIEAALDKGAAIIVRAKDWERLPEALRARARAIERWPRLTRSASPAMVVAAFRSGEPAGLYEDVLAVAAVRN